MDTLAPYSCTKFKDFTFDRSSSCIVFFTQPLIEGIDLCITKYLFTASQSNTLWGLGFRLQNSRLLFYLKSPPIWPNLCSFLEEGVKSS